MAGSLSSQDEAVEAVKIGLQGQEEGTVKNRNSLASDWINSMNCKIFCGRIDLSITFNSSSGVTSLIYFRFDFDADLQTLVIYVASGIHASAVLNFYHILNSAMKSQEEMCGDELDWIISINSSFWIEDNEFDRSIKSGSTFVANIIIKNQWGESVFVVEIAFSQCCSNAIAKVQKIFTRNPLMLAAVVISLDESPQFHPPERDSSEDNFVDRNIWFEMVNQAPAFRPINISDHCWMGSITASFNIQFKNETELRIGKSGIIPKSPDTDVDASAALKEPWGKLVRTFAGEDAIPVELDKVVQKSLGRVAYMCIAEAGWVRSCEELKRRVQIELQAEGSKRPKHV
ncbi:hypothetical protein PILCRDRAFT_13457 [Piloderma croceum F 1598]|uniref:Uncharacterized protein n=1 Tax=Piloderma croceum (strain F 1598) TaxID=765440 RepID=A0A0C3ANP9_PILCF|nr:hypothetical protein PILCRDRAFT_13457 [Piloderma croceum F 1598]